MNEELLTSLYQIDSKSSHEEEMMKFIEQYVSTIEGTYLTKDSYNNIYVVKGESTSYPCIVAHMDK